MLLMQEDDKPRGLCVERAGNVRDGRVDELFNLRVRDGARLADFVDRAAVLGEVDEGVGGRHFGCCGCECPCSWGGRKINTRPWGLR